MSEDTVKPDATMLVEYKTKAEQLETEIDELKATNNKLRKQLEDDKVFYLESQLTENEVRVRWHHCMETIQQIERNKPDYRDDLVDWAEHVVAETRGRLRHVRSRHSEPVWLWRVGSDVDEIKRIQIERHDQACYLASEAEYLMYKIRSQCKAEQDGNPRWDDGPSYLGAAMYAVDMLIKELERYKKTARAYLGSTDGFGFDWDD